MHKADRNMSGLFPKTRLSAIALLIAAFLITSVYPKNTQAFALQPHPRVCTELFHRSPTVFVGTVTSERKRFTEDGEYWDAYIYQLSVHEVFVGNLAGEVEILTGNGSGRLPLNVAQTYLLFAHDYEGDFYIGGGGNSSEISEAGGTIKEIRRVLAEQRTAKGGNIRGHIYVVPFDIPEEYKQGAGGITFIAEGSAGRFSGVTDEDGWFEISAPSGEYRVFPEPSQPHLEARDISYNDPEHVIVDKGTCAEVGFVVQRQVR